MPTPTLPDGPLAEFQRNSPGSPIPESVLAREEIEMILEPALARAEANLAGIRRAQPRAPSLIRRAAREVTRLEKRYEQLHRIAFPASPEEPGTALASCIYCAASIAPSRVFSHAGRCGECWDRSTHPDRTPPDDDDVESRPVFGSVY